MRASYLINKPTRYLFALLFTAAALGVQFAILYGANESNMGVLYPVAFLAAWYFGFGPAVLSILFGAVGALSLFYEPDYSFFFYSGEALARIIVFILTSLFVAKVIDAGSRAEINYRDTKNKLLESESLLRVVTDRLPAFVSYMGNDRRYRFVNRAYSEWFGKSSAEIQGRTRSELVNHVPTYDHMKPYEDKAFAGEEVSFDFVLEKRNTPSKFLDAEFLPDFDPISGNVRGIIGVSHDVTQRMLAQKDLENLAVDLQSAISARDDFLSIASHELRTPITGMKIQTQMMKRGFTKEGSQLLTPERFKKFVDQTDHGLDRMSRLVEDMLDISRIQSGKLHLQIERVNLADLIRETFERYALQFSHAKIDIHFQAPEMRVELELDRFRIEQVVINLITNAIRYAPGKPVHAKLDLQDQRVIFSFRDHGPGISPDNQEVIFQRFERLISPNEISGLGLGLYIVREIIRAHGGSIRVESASGQGACFVTELPVKDTA